MFDIDVKALSQSAANMAIEFAPKVLLAVLILFIGFRIVSWAGRLLKNVFDRNKIDASFQPFLVSIVEALLKVMVLLSAASVVGIETTSFVAIIGAAGLAIGLALQGSLANFAGSVLIMIFKPYKVGDTINVQGQTGDVKYIQTFTTTLLTADNKLVIIPNGVIANGVIVNITAEPYRRLDLNFTINHKDDLLKAKNIFKKVTDVDERVLDKPAPDIFVEEINAVGIKFAVRVYVKQADYLPVMFDMSERIQLALAQEGFSVPYNQVGTRALS
ncbi:MAG: mechanosensitive ion channel family protein [Cytophagales bacterium]|nr:MAG: mechanosensitive ion channel family protein [Cytophagales bacterium]TAF61932.1 MAG: mechanosensitive ion channel family protein [Cytophagales bacterium]